MAEITETEVRQMIALNLGDESDILAVEHRAVEDKIMDYVVQEVAKVAKSKVLILENWTTDRNYTIDTGLSPSAKISGVIVMLVCKNPNNGFGEGDTVTAPTPYPQDSGRTSAQGVGVQFNNSSNNVIRIMVNDQVTIMTAYNSGLNAVANNIQLSGGATANWSIKLIVGYN